MNEISPLSSAFLNLNTAATDLEDAEYHLEHGEFDLAIRGIRECMVQLAAAKGKIESIKPENNP